MILQRSFEISMQKPFYLFGQSQITCSRHTHFVTQTVYCHFPSMPYINRTREVCNLSRYIIFWCPWTCLKRFKGTNTGTGEQNLAQVCHFLFEVLFTLKRVAITWPYIIYKWKRMVQCKRKCCKRTSEKELVSFRHKALLLWFKKLNRGAEIDMLLIFLPLSLSKTLMWIKFKQNLIQD